MTFYNLYSIFFVMLVYFCPWICVTLDASHRHPPEALVSRVIDLVVAWDTEGRWVGRDRYSNRGFPQCFVGWEAWLHLATHACRNWLRHFLWGYGLKVLVRVWFLCHCSIVTLNFCLQRGRGAHSLVLLRWTGLLRLCPYNWSIFHRILTTCATSNNKLLILSKSYNRLSIRRWRAFWVSSTRSVKHWFIKTWRSGHRTLTLRLQLLTNEEIITSFNITYLGFCRVCEYIAV